MAPSQIQIQTSALSRLLKEEASYYTEMESQRKRIVALEDEEKSGKPEPEGEEGNRGYALKQERKALDETKAVLPTLRERITSAREKLESSLDSASDQAEIEKARAILQLAKEAQKNDPDSAEKGVA